MAQLSRRKYTCSEEGNKFIASFLTRRRNIRFNLRNNFQRHFLLERNNKTSAVSNH